MSNRIHHINFLVRDLQPAVERYRALLAFEEVQFEDLPARGVKTARFKLGETWIVLVQPVDPTGIPARRLEEQGEGFFLISYAVDDLDEATDLAIRAGVSVLGHKVREGLSDWQVRDLDKADLFGVESQLTAESD